MQYALSFLPKLKQEALQRQGALQRQIEIQRQEAFRQEAVHRQLARQRQVVFVPKNVLLASTGGEAVGIAGEASDASPSFRQALKAGENIHGDDLKVILRSLSSVGNGSNLRRCFYNSSLGVYKGRL